MNAISSALDEQLDALIRRVHELSELDEILTLLISRLTERVGIRYGAVFLRRSGGDFILAKGCNLPEHVAVKLPKQGKMIEVLETDHAMHQPDHPLFPMLIPLVEQGFTGRTLIGALGLGPKINGLAYTKSEEDLLMLFADNTGDAINVARLIQEARGSDSLLRTVIQIGVTLSAEKQFDNLLERILLEAKALSHADGGTLYLREGDVLNFMIVHNDSLKVQQGGANHPRPELPPVPLTLQDGTPNHHNVASYTALTMRTVNIADAYDYQGEFDFSGTRAFDEHIGYRSTSFLCVPLKNYEGELVGVLQLINALNPSTQEVIPFDKKLEEVVESLSSLAGVALTSYLREQALRQEIVELRIQIDQAKRQQEVKTITGQHTFENLREQARKLREENQKEG